MPTTPGARARPQPSHRRNQGPQGTCAKSNHDLCPRTAHTSHHQQCQLSDAPMSCSMWSSQQALPLPFIWNCLRGQAGQREGTVCRAKGTRAAALLSGSPPALLLGLPCLQRCGWAAAQKSQALRFTSEETDCRPHPHSATLHTSAGTH